MDSEFLGQPGFVFLSAAAKGSHARMGAGVGGVYEFHQTGGDDLPCVDKMQEVPFGRYWIQVLD
jgi:hypothetical protein